MSLLSLALGAIGTFAVPQFESIYSSFGVDVPLETKVLFSCRQFLWLPCLFVIAIWYATKTRSNISRVRYFSTALFIEVNLLLLVLWALYAGIFMLGCI
jgi:type II secretory pathway component PulF